MFREMRRFKQQLSGAECADILTRAPRGVMALSGDGGYPYAVPLDFVYDAEANKLYFHCAAEGHKIDAMRRSDKVSFCVLDEGVPSGEDWSLYFKSVIVFGRLRMLTDRDEVIEKVRLLGLKYYPDAADVEAELRKDGARVQCLELTVEHMTGKRVHEK